MTSLDINQLLGNCINGSHYNISLYIFQLIKEKYRYNNKKWILLNNNIINDNNINDNNINDNNINDNNKKIENKLKDDIKTLIFINFGNRSIFWSKNIDNENKVKSIKFLQVIDKMKNEKFLKDIIKELTQFYE